MSLTAEGAVWHGFDAHDGRGRLPPTFSRSSEFQQIIGRDFSARDGVTLHYAYSLGESFGYVQKILNKDWLCNTWERRTGHDDGARHGTADIQFSVRDDATAQRIEQRRYCITYFTLTRYVGTEGKISFTIAELDRYLERRPSVT